MCSRSIACLTLLTMSTKKKIFKQVKREPMLTKVRFGQSIFISVVIGILFFDLDKTMLGVRNRAGIEIELSHRRVKTREWTQ